MQQPRGNNPAPTPPAPITADAWIRQGREHWQRAEHAQAAECAHRALQQGARPLDAYGLLGDSLLALRQFEPAFNAYASALALDATNTTLRFLCGETLFHLGRYEEVVAYLKDLEPGNQQALAIEHAMTLGRALQKLGMTEQSELSLLKAYMLQPDSENAVCNLAALYEEGGRHALAIPFLESAIRTHPHSVRLHYNLGSDLSQCGQVARCIEVLRHTLELAPDHIKAHQNLALALLLSGDLEAGWTHYAWRFNRHSAEGGQADWIPKTPRLPTDLTGRTVRVMGEQGIGDELFFMRYLPALHARGARVLYRLCNAKLLPLLPHLQASDLIDAFDTHNATADISVLAGDLPFALGEPHVRDCPPPLKFNAEMLATQNWIARSALLQRNRPRLGIAWRAGTAPLQHPTDQNQWLSKSMPLDALMDVLAPLPVDLVVLQRLPYPHELQYIEQRIGAERLLDASQHDTDLVELLALLSLLDGLVGVSNTNVHLAAGLGKSIDTLVPLPYEFRWSMESAASPWFPGSGVFRQQPDGDWQAALAQLQIRLQQRFEQDKQRP